MRVNDVFDLNQKNKSRNVCYVKKQHQKSSAPKKCVYCTCFL